MITLIWCLILAALLPYIAKAPLAAAMNKLGGYDNNHPREQQTKLTGFGARALAAHQNAFESLIVFTAAILLAIATNTTGETIQTLAIAHIVLRVAYHLLYLLNIGLLRSIVWGFGIACSFAIMWLCIPS
ncbi:MAPEG family protein [Thalassotalea euphylliae]|uniref:MAPEG family protein n=1 Tax=Thalassotalea euphylliae TaxID=1655234 RepID=A0A3E0UI93_9GAMM|nr:MAPEG family protein [Thalassotalea euphylliae]REL36343.1 MAPEG family protein [Thalassotalea euphylliae]